MQVKGCVFSQFECRTQRSLDATSPVNDLAIGIYLDCTVDIGLAGGNASILIKGSCSVHGTKASVRKGVFGYGKMADISVEIETVGCNESLHLKAVGTAANNVDIRLIHPTLDQPSRRGLVLEDFPPGSQVDIISPYVGVPATASDAIFLHNCHADVNIIGGQLIGVAGGTTFGIRALNSTAPNIQGTGVLDFPNPVFLDGTTDARVQPNISNPNTTAIAYGVGLSGDCDRTIIEAKVNGKPNAFPAAAVMLFTDTIENVRINTERIDPSSVSGGRKLMLGALNINIVTTGRYLADGSPSAAGTIMVEGLPAGDTRLPLANSIFVGAEKVVGPRQPAIPNHTSDLTINSIPTALRNHGLISS